MSYYLDFKVKYKDGTVKPNPFGFRYGWGAPPTNKEFLKRFFGNLDFLWTSGYRDRLLADHPDFMDIIELEYEGQEYEVRIPEYVAYMDNYIKDGVCPTGGIHKWTEVGLTQGDVTTGRRCDKCQKQEWY